MRRIDEDEIKVDIAIEDLWRALTKDLQSVVPLSLPNLVKEVKVLEGDGGFDTVYLFEFKPDVPIMSSYQKEKVVDFDESVHQIGLEVIEGGRLSSGFTFYKNTFQLTALGILETLVNVKVEYDSEETRPPGQTLINSTFSFIQSLQTFLQKHGS